jgi:hypothetical protein
VSPFNAVPVNTPQGRSVLSFPLGPRARVARAWYWQHHVRRFDSGRGLFNLCVVVLFMGCQYHACCSGISATNPGQALDKNPLPYKRRVLVVPGAAAKHLLFYGDNLDTGLGRSS